MALLNPAPRELTGFGMRSVRASAGALALAGLLLVGCAGLGRNLTPPEVSLIDLKPLPSESFEQRFELKLRVLNPNDVAIAGDGVDLVLDVNGRRLARAVSAEPFTVPRLSDAVVTLIATTNLIDLFRQALALPTTTELDYVLDGRLFLAGSPGSLRFSHEGSLVPEGSFR